MITVTKKPFKGDDQFAVWRNKLAGGDTPLAPDEVFAGFYQNRGRAYAYWWRPDTGEAAAIVSWTLRLRIDGKDITDANRPFTDFPYAWKNPVSREAYDEYIATGKWPGQNAVVQETLSNNPPEGDTLESIRDQIDSLAAEARRLVKAGAAKSKDAVDQAADVATRLSELRSKADKLRAVEKQPFLDGGRDVDSKWKPIIEEADIYRQIKSAVCDPWLREENERIAAINRENARKAKEAADRAAEEEEALLRQHRDAQKKADEEGTVPPPAPKLEEVKLEYVAPPLLESARAGTRKAVTTRKVITAIITDWDKLWSVMKDREDVKEFFQSIADKAAKGGNPLAGTESSEGSKAV